MKFCCFPSKAQVRKAAACQSLSPIPLFSFRKARTRLAAGASLPLNLISFLYKEWRGRFYEKTETAALRSHRSFLLFTLFFRAEYKIPEKLVKEMALP